MLSRSEHRWAGAAAAWPRSPERYRLCRPPTSYTLFWPLASLILLAGCGGAALSGSGVRIDGAQPAIRTGEPLHLSAVDPGTGDPLRVRWRIVSSNNAAALGPGTLSPDGVYSPPGILSRDSVSVTLAAVPEAGSSAPATTTLMVLPGFAQPLQPENASLPPGGSLELRAQLSEVGSGSVRWQLAGATDGQGNQDGQALGSLGAQHCERGSGQFTTCTITYTAPSTFSPGTSVSVTASTVASAAGSGAGSGAASAGAAALPGASVRARILLGSVTSNAALHQQEQRAPMALGVSGSNDNDFDTYVGASGANFVADCCGGTLGALVEDSAGQPYLLSNNHVLATSDQAHTGDAIEQPGLIDNGCIPLREPGSQLRQVGSLRYQVPLRGGARGSWNVDAALASLAPGAIDPTGAILELGEPIPGSTAGLRSAPPMSGIGEVLDAGRLTGLSVVKSGRTTGLTCSSVEAVDLRVAVDYYEDCAETRHYTTKTFTGQIAVGGDSFADSGDSGALVLDAANAEAVGLLYATATTRGQMAASGMAGAGLDGLTLLHPIGEVLRELGAQAGTTFSLRGTSTPHRVACLDYGQGAGRTSDGSRGPAALAALTPDERARTAAAVAQGAALHEANPRGVLAVAPGASADDPGHGAVLVYVDREQPWSSVPASVAGVRTVVVPTDLATIARGPAAWPAPARTPGIHLREAALARATVAANTVAPRLMEVPGVFGAGVAQSLDAPDEAALLVLLDSDAPTLQMAQRLQAQAEPAAAGAAAGTATGLPPVLGGLRVRYVRMHRFHVTRSKYLGAADGSQGGSSCSALQRLAR